MSTVTEPRSLNEPADVEQPVRKTWTEEEVYRLCGMGFFGSNRIELIDGEILTMSPAGSMHDAVVCLTADLLRTAFGKGYAVRVQAGLGLARGTEPQPDVLVVEGDQRDYLQKKPSSAALVVEASDTSLKFDCGEKAGLYAQFGIADYWVVDLENRKLIVHRDPRPDASQPRGAAYANVVTLGEKDSISPLADPNASFLVADFLP